MLYVSNLGFLFMLPNFKTYIPGRSDLAEIITQGKGREKRAVYFKWE
jgi:hypothetical protein